MASLRDPLLGLDNAPSAEWQAAAAEAARPNSLRGGWEAGRIGAERNALAIDEFAARAAGDNQRADTLRMQNEALGQAQARVVPRVQKVEDIHSVGDGLNWAGGAIGQGVSSMVEPVAAATALGAVGRVAGMLPGAAGKVGAAIGTVGGPLAAYALNQRQLAGEFANTAMQDQELMARTTPQERYNMANMYGGVAGLADTALPGIIGHQLTGGTLRAGMKAAGAGMGPAAKTALGMAGEGFTEYGQGKGSQYAQGLLNPNRDTSGDASDDLNNALGGAIGGGPLIAAGAYADAGYRRVGRTAEQIGTKTGDLVDLAKAKYDGSALQGGVDKAMAAGKQKAGDMVDLLDHVRGDDGKISLAKMADLAESARDGANELVQRYKVSAEERDLLNLTPPPEVLADPTKNDAWFADASEKRTQLVADRLSDMAETDPKAAEILDRLANTEDYVQQQAIADEGAQHVLETNEIEQLATRADRAAAAFGELASKGASAMGKGAVTAGKAVMKFGKAVFDGAAGEMRKKNAQGEDYTAKGYEAWQERTGRAATDRVVQGAKNSPAAAQAKRRGEVFGEMLGAEAQAALTRRGIGGTRAKNIAALVQDAGYELAHMSGGGKPSALATSRIARTLRTALGARAEQVVTELQALADPKSAKLFDQIRSEIANGRTLSGQQQERQVRAAAANQLVSLLPAEDMQAVLKSEAAGGKLNRDWLLNTIEGLANGHESPQLRKALNEKFGEETVAKMLDVVGGALPAPKLMKGTVDDGGVQGESGVNDDGEYEAEQASDFDKRQAEKKVSKGSGPKVYGFYRTGEQSLRGSTDRRDPFAPISKMSKSEELAFRDENVQREAEGLEPLAGAPVKRPGLFKLTDTVSEELGGGSALERKIADLEKVTEKTGHSVGARSALEVMKDLNFQPAKILSVYRDYLRQDAGSMKLSADERAAARAMADKVNRAVLDTMEQKGEGKRVMRLSAGERKEIKEAAEAYFKERYVAVAEKLSDTVPDRVELTELLSMGRAGAQALEASRKPGVDTNAFLDEANLITFQSDLLRTKDRGLHIRADTLVNWVRAQRARNETKADAKEDNSNNAKNKTYLADLLEGITAVVDSGLVDERMPARINGKGEYESFAKGTPPSLRLATMTYGAMEFGKKKRAEARGRVEDPLGPNEEDVAQDQARNEEFFVTDPLEGTAPEPSISRGQGQTMTAEEEAQFAALNTAKERREFLKNLGLKQSGEQFGDARAADAKSDGDNATPLDFFPKQKPGAVPDEFADQQFRTTKKAADAAMGPEPKMSSMAKAPERGAEIVRALRKDFASGVAVIESRLRSAARPESIADPKAREISAVGGQHYVMPLAHALNLDTIAGLDLGPAEAKQLMTLRGEAAKAILLADKLSDAQKVALTKAMAPAASADKVNLANYAKLLQKASQAAREVAAKETPKFQSKPSGVDLGAKGVIAASRLGIIADKAGAKTDPDVAKAANELITLASDAWGRGTDKKEFLQSGAARGALAVLAARKLVGAPRAQEAIDAVMATVDQIYGVVQDRVLLNKVRARLVETMMSKRPVMLADILADYATSRLPAGVKAIARAVQKVAGDTAVRAESTKAIGAEGVYNSTTDSITVGLGAFNPLHTVLHEGVHAATISAVVRDAELHKALYSLMAHAVAHDPALQQAYGFSNTLEFLAEGLSNSGLQRRLYKVPANKTVEKYLGATVANAWDAFVALVRKALNLPAEHQSALTQLLDLSGRAMKAVGQSPDRLTSADEHASAAERTLVPQKMVERLVKQLADLPALSKETRESIYDQFSPDDSPHFDALVLTALIKELTSKPVPDGSITPDALQHIGDELASALEHAAFPNKIGAADWSDTGARKLSAMSTEIHNDLQRGGFAATHDSPIRHEGKFDWRKHAGSGKGDESFGAGTYLSTGEKVHTFYKKMSTALAGQTSPTYHVSVSAMKAQLLNWDKPLSEQSSYVRRRLIDAGMEGQDLTGAGMYRALARNLGSKAAASDYLQSLGILGHEYAASNGRDGTTPNYVIYDDSKITTNYVHFNRQGGNSRVAAQAEMDEAKAYVRKVLGPQIKVEFKGITGYSGEWLDAQQAIEISTTAAAGVLSTAYHEALHGFFSKFVKNDPRALETLKSLAENEKILARVAALLADHPAALDQLKSGEERLAYIYQFWAAGKLDLPIGKPRTLLQKVRKFFRRVLGLVRDSERAVALFEAFHGGQLAEPSAAGKVIAKVLDEGTGVLKARRSIDGLTQWLAAKTMPAETILATSESKAAQALAKEFFTNPGEEAAGGEAEGYLNARRRVAARYNNTFAQAIRGLSDRDMTQVSKYLQAEAELADIPYAPHREAVAKIRGLLQRFYKYMSDERGLELGHAGEKYYPRVWNTALLHEKKDDFLKMLTTHYDAVLEQGVQGSKGKLSKDQVADRIWRALIDREGVNDKLDAQRQDGVLAPFFASKENRTLAWLQGEHAEPFLEKNLVATLSRYFHQGVRAAEYTERFGADGEILEAKLREIMGELQDLSHAKRKEFKDDAARAKWVSRQYRDISEAVGAMEGTLGKDISPGWRKANSWMTVYQNVRLLPLSLFASFVDPLGMVARGATMREAYEAFLRGMKEVVTNWGDLFREEPKERQADKWEKLAEHVGAVDAALFAHHVSDEYSSVYMERGAKTINDMMFKLNGMEAWNRGMRVAGVKSAVAFIERHAAGADKVHSERWLKELGLDPKNIPLDADGHLITDKSVLMQQKGVGKAQAEREIDAVHYAINRWVEGAILTPNAAQRPAWGSDPHYSMFFHLKQFSYSFHQTILKRAVKEMNHGNLAPMGAFVWYIPTMIAADITKGLIQGGGELPAYMKGYDAGGWVMHGVQRAGLLGAAQLGVDAQGDMFSLAGPGVEQAIDAMREPLSETTIKALPAHGLYAQALR